MKRPDVQIDKLNYFLENKYSKEEIEEVEIMAKYEGYIKKQILEAEKSKEYENIKLDENIDYKAIDNLALEAREKLNKVNQHQ